MTRMRAARAFLGIAIALYSLSATAQLRGTDLVFVGTYNAATSYVPGDVVTYIGSSYVALRSGKGVSPVGSSASATNWTVMAQAGATGPQGLPGPQGFPGLAGANGLQGLPGAAGMTGPQGAVGPTGLQGLAGAAGAQGIAGPQGIPGSPGPVGQTGPQGPSGATGPQGVQGVPGLDKVGFLTSKLFCGSGRQHSRNLRKSMAESSASADRYVSGKPGCATCAQVRGCS